MPETKLTTTTFLLTMEHPEGKQKEALEYLSDLGEAKVYEAPKETAKTKAEGPAFDSYGNPYNKDTKRSTECDAYGNPYNKDGKPAEAPADPNARYDAYGNKY